MAASAWEVAWRSEVGPEASAAGDESSWPLGSVASEPTSGLAAAEGEEASTDGISFAPEAVAASGNRPMQAIVAADAPMHRRRRTLMFLMIAPHSRVMTNSSL